MKFRKKPVVVDAEQWFPGHEIEGVERLTHETAVLLGFNDLENFYRYGVVNTIEGDYVVSPGDWIISENNRRYICKPNIFKTSYEPTE